MLNNNSAQSTYDVLTATLIVRSLTQRT